MYTYKIMLLPNNKQRTRLLQTMNKCIECQNIVLNDLMNCLSDHVKIPSSFEYRKYFTKLKKEKDKELDQKAIGLTNKEKRIQHLNVHFKDVSNDALKQTIKDTYTAMSRYFKKTSDCPKKHKFYSNHKSFYVDPLKIKFEDKKVKLEKLTLSTKGGKAKFNWVKLAEKSRIPLNVTYYNPRVIYHNNKFRLTISVDDKDAPKKRINKEHKIDKLGIDLNINSINLSNEKVFQSVNNTLKIKRLERIRKLYQKALSRKYEVLKKNKTKTREGKNYRKNLLKLEKIYTRLQNLRTQHNDEIINYIIDLNPKKIVVESLDVKEMSQNKILSPKIQIVGFRKFLDRLKSRIRYEDIELVEANKYFPSSKKCSRCGNIKKDLTLNDRVYKCDKCGLVIDRDLNAAINLSNY